MFLLGMTTLSSCSMLIPPAARITPYMVLVIRVIQVTFYIYSDSEKYMHYDERRKENKALNEVDLRCNMKLLYLKFRDTVRL